MRRRGADHDVDRARHDGAGGRRAVHAVHRRRLARAAARGQADPRRARRVLRQGVEGAHGAAIRPAVPVGGERGGYRPGQQRARRGIVVPRARAAVPGGCRTHRRGLVGRSAGHGGCGGRPSGRDPAGGGARRGARAGVRRGEGARVQARLRQRARVLHVRACRHVGRAGCARQPAVPQRRHLVVLRRLAPRSGVLRAAHRHRASGGVLDRGAGALGAAGEVLPLRRAGALVRIRLRRWQHVRRALPPSAAQHR